MSWIIDVDHIATPGATAGTNENAVGLMGPRGYAGDGSELTHKFRMFDDDGELYYEGRCSSCDDDDAFGPLDDFGQPNAGCAKIRYLMPLYPHEEDGHWYLL